MNVPAEFDSIRPYEPEELPQAYERLLADPQFRQVLAFALPGVPLEQIREKMMACKTNYEFQLSFCYNFVQFVVDKLTAGCGIDASAVDKTGRYTFVSNHRDIVLDSGFLDKLLVDAGFNTTCEIAIGNNLLSLPWVKDLVRVNKSFIVRRGLTPRETLAASRLMSDYMHFVIEKKHDNIWIAQREGRAKDSDDRTQPAILKMMAIGGGSGSVTEKLRRLHIAPLAISYEFDPCDFLKAKEFQLKRDNAGWKKSAEDDVVSMQTGIMGYKGRVHYQLRVSTPGLTRSTRQRLRRRYSTSSPSTSTTRYTATTACTRQTTLRSTLLMAAAPSPINTPTRIKPSLTNTLPANLQKSTFPARTTTSLWSACSPCTPILQETISRPGNEPCAENIPLCCRYGARCVRERGL